MHINLSFIEAILHMSKYVKFLKGHLTKKKKRKIGKRKNKLWRGERLGFEREKREGFELDKHERI